MKIQSIRINRDRSRIFWTLFLLAFIVIIIVLGGSYSHFQESIRDAAIRLEEDLAILLRNAVDRTLQDVHQSLVKIVADPASEHFMVFYRNREEYIVEIRELLERLNAKIGYNPYYTSCFLYYEKEGVILDIGLERILSIDQMQSWGADWEYLERSKRAIEETLEMMETDGTPESTQMGVYTIENGEGHRMPIFVKSVKNSAPGNRILLYMTIEDFYFDQLLQKVGGLGEQHFFIIDENGRVIARNVENTEDEQFLLSSGELEMLTEGPKSKNCAGRFLITYVESEQYHWKILISESSSVAFAASRTIGNQLLILLGICTLLSVLGAFMFAGKLHMPIVRIADEIEKIAPLQRSSKEAETDFIRKGVSQIANQWELAQSRLAESMPILKNAALNSLLSGHSIESSSIRSYHADLAYDGFYSVFVLLLSADSRKDTDFGVGWEEVTLMELAQQARKDFSDIFLEHIQRNSGETVFIASSQAENEKQAEEWVVQLIHAIQKLAMQLGCGTVTAGLGNTCRSLEQISRSYKEASHALNLHILYGNGSLVLYRDTPKVQQWYYVYPFEVEKRLFLQLKAGDAEKVRSALDEYVFYVVEHDLNPTKDMYVFIHLLDNTIKTCVELGLDVQEIFAERENLYRELLNLGEIFTIRKWFQTLFEQIMQYAQVKWDGKSEEIASQTKQLIHRSYADPNLSLHYLAEQIHYSESYLSKAFRLTYNDTIKHYITTLRMEEASRLLVESALQIREVAKKVGFPNPQAFLKTFKKVFGETPSEYQQRCRLWGNEGENR